MKRIGLLGGSFNPVHNGHLKLAREAMAELNLDRVIFVPSYLTPLKNSGPLLPPGLRVRLLRIALKHCSRFSISLCEMRRRGVSYTVDTLKFFRRKFGRGAVLYFLTGADALKNFARWKSPRQILKLCRPVAVTRPGYTLEKVPQGVLRLPMTPFSVSSSDIRRRLKKNGSIRSLVPRGTETILKKYFNRHQGEKNRRS
jgi:nicotinate-nucleotide adenylyltransferase